MEPRRASRRASGASATRCSQVVGPLRLHENAMHQRDCPAGACDALSLTVSNVRSPQYMQPSVRNVASCCGSILCRRGRDRSARSKRRLLPPAPRCASANRTERLRCNCPWLVPRVRSSMISCPVFGHADFVACSTRSYTGNLRFWCARPLIADASLWPAITHQLSPVQ